MILNNSGIVILELNLNHIVNIHSTGLNSKMPHCISKYHKYISFSKPCITYFWNHYCQMMKLTIMMYN